MTALQQYGYRPQRCPKCEGTGFSPRYVPAEDEMGLPAVLEWSCRCGWTFETECADSRVAAKDQTSAWFAAGQSPYQSR